MGIIDRLRGRAEPSTEELVGQLTERLGQSENNRELLSESLAELELALEDTGWVRMGIEGNLDFSTAGIRRIIRLSRLMWLKNPLIQHGVKVQADYVFGQGVQIKATDDRIDAVVQRFLRNPDNEKVLTKHQARWERERDLQVEGQLFLAMFVNSSTGDVVVRTLPVLEIDDIITNPDDVDEPWWYKRVWHERVFDLRTGTYQAKPKTVYYRDWRIPSKAERRATIGGAPVAKDVYVYHVKVGALRGMKFGVPETYASMDWARAYNEWLSNWASLEKALARFAWRMTGKTGQLKKAKTMLGTTVDTAGVEDNPPPTTGATAQVPAGGQLEAMPKSGAHVSAEDGTQLRKMAAAGMGIPDPIMSSDPQQGTMATAKTLDRPTELSMRGRQMLWADVFRAVLGFAVRKAKAAPNGALQEAERDEAVPDLETTISVTFPPVLERDIRDAVRAWVDAATMGGRDFAGTLPMELVTKGLLTALSVEDMDKAIEGFTPGEIPAEARPQIEAAVRELRKAFESEVRGVLQETAA